MDTDILSLIDLYDILLLYIGIVILAISVIPKIISEKVITSPIVYLGFSIVFFSLLSHSPLPHLAEEPYLGKRLTELGVIISLTSAGLKLKNPFAFQT